MSDPRARLGYALTHEQPDIVELARLLEQVDRADEQRLALPEWAREYDEDVGPPAGENRRRANCRVGTLCGQCTAKRRDSQVPITFKKATKTQSKLRMALAGPSGSGKTFTGLVFATALANGGKVAVIDTERGSSAKYSDLFEFDQADMRELYPRDTFDPANYIECIETAEAAGYAVVLIDSLSHAWEGEGGVLDKHDAASKRTGNSFTAWKDVTPVHRRLVDTILGSPCHIIVTMRSKMDYIQTQDDKGRTVIKKVGMAPVQRQGMEYEFDIVGDLDIDHNLIITKTRYADIDNAVVNKPDARWFGKVAAWLGEGAPAPEPEPKPHWANKADTTAKFFLWAGEQGLDEAQALDALQVDSLDQYPGSKAQAAEAIKMYAAALAAQDGAA